VVKRGGAKVLAVVIVAIAIWSGGRVAYADNVSDLINDLQTNSSDKVRLSAALNLPKLQDNRAVPALVGALKNDSDKNVRGASALGLSTLLQGQVPAGLKKQAIAQLQDSAANDSSSFVQRQASNALARIGSGGSTAASNSGGGGAVYVNVGPMSSKAGLPNDAALRTSMVKTATKLIPKTSPALSVTWPGGGAPTAAQLAAKQTQGFYVDGTLNEVKVKSAGGSATISCKISMLIASYPDKSMFGFLNGGASVQGGAGDADVAQSIDDCVSAVVESLITSKIVPTIKTKAGIP
jgi:hypothetical protein